MASSSHGLLASSRNDLGRKTVWICGSCTAFVRGVQPTSSRSINPRIHQRRLSSSKTSRPSKSDARAISTPTDEVAARSAKTSSVSQSKDNPGDARTKGREKSRSHLPSVPSTQYLHPIDVQVASFFAVGRPISVTSSIPPLSTATDFSSIFAPSYHPKVAPSDVLYTLSSAVSRLENSSSQTTLDEVPEEVDIRTALTQSPKAIKSDNAIRLDDSQPQVAAVSLDNLKQHFRPFHTPPPPVPFETLAEGQDTQGPKARRRRTTHKAYSMTVNILESTDADGQTSYSASTSDVYEDSRLVHATIKTPRQPFLDRMQERQRRTSQIREYGPHKDAWRLISVKRQRKLKMKKHKYKKLMKRTRTLRRKLERG